MFLGSDIIEFVNKIINSDNSEYQNKDHEYEAKLNSLKEFTKYLTLTKMTDQDTLKYVEKIIECFPEIFELRKKLGNFDINNLLNDMIKKIDKSDQTLAKQKLKKYEEKHYNHYYESSSSSCGSSSTSTNRC